MLALGIHLASLPNVLSVLTSQALPQAEAACVHEAVLGLAEGQKKYSMSLKKSPWWINSWDKLNTAHLKCRAVFHNFSHGWPANCHSLDSRFIRFTGDFNKTFSVQLAQFHGFTCFTSCARLRPDLFSSAMARCDLIVIRNCVGKTVYHCAIGPTLVDQIKIDILLDHLKWSDLNTQHPQIINSTVCLGWNPVVSSKSTIF